MPIDPLAEVDLLPCAQEPIHIPGAIQPHGCLLVFAESELRVLQASANCADWIGVAPEQLLGRCLADVLEADTTRALESALDADAGEGAAPGITVAGRRVDVAVHRNAGARIIELTAAAPAALGAAAETGLGRTLEQLAGCTTLPQFTRVLAEGVRALSGFDRVVTYRFDVDGHGEVVAEARDDALAPYLGLHFPESDIPAQARELYRRNWLRTIPDARYQRVPLVPALRPDSGLPLDLGQAALRSVSPVHLEYMANMGVQASMSISLVVGDRLWGLVSAGHATPREVPRGLQRACETVGRVASLQIGALEAIELQQRRDAKAAPLRSLAERLHAGGAELLDGLIADPQALLDLTHAHGTAIVVGDQVQGAGLRPPLLDVLRLAQWLHDRAPPGGVFQSRQLGVDAPEWASLGPNAAGVLACVMPVAARGCLIWFRSEQPYTVDWGGNPHKGAGADRGEGVEVGPTGLHPRKSFTLWKEVVRGRAEPWALDEIDAASDLRRSAVEVDLARQVARERAAVRARDDVVAVVSHDLRTPMSVVVMQAEIIERLLGSGAHDSSQRLLAAAQTIQRAGRRMTRMLSELLDLAKIEAGRFAVVPQRLAVVHLVEEARELLAALAQAEGVALVVTHADDASVHADPERIFQVFSNLIGNAIKATRGGGRIEIRAEQRGNVCEFSITDTGHGIAPDQLGHIFERYWQGQPSDQRGAGLGLYIAEGIVRAHGGTIRAESEIGHGARFVFGLPLAEKVPANAAR